MDESNVGGNLGNDVDQSGNFLSKQKVDANSENINAYDTEPLPFHATANQESKLTWADFDQDDSGKDIFLYRGVRGGSRERTEHLSPAASLGKNQKDIFADAGTSDIRQIVDASSAVAGFYGADPTLHTTRSKKLAADFAEANMRSSSGEVITYRVPKDWLIQNKDQAIIGHQDEKEIDFFHSLPSEFVHKIEKVSGIAKEMGIEQSHAGYADTGLPQQINISDLNEEGISQDTISAPPPPPDEGQGNSWF